MTALVRGVAHHTTPCGPDTDRDQCPTNRRDGYAPTCGHPEADHHDHQCPEENDVSTYTCTFEGNRIGRNHDVEPLTVTVKDFDELAEKVYDYARPRLGSRDVEVAANVDEMRGLIFAGMRCGGRFTIKPVAPAADTTGGAA